MNNNHEDKFWNVTVLTCRDQSKDFRLPLAEELHLAGHRVYYIFLKRRPVVMDMRKGSETKEMSIIKFLWFMLSTFRINGKKLPFRRKLFFNSTNLVFPFLSRFLRTLCGGVWCFDMHDDLLYGKKGSARIKGVFFQQILLAGSDLVVHAAPTLQRLFPKSHHLGNASSLRSIERPQQSLNRILVLASIDKRLDFSVLAEAAALEPSLTFELYGHFASDNREIRIRIEELTQRFTNIIYAGPYLNDDLQKILASYSVTLAPYVVGSPLTEYIDPLRYYHCLNSGMEVISTGIPKAHDFGDILHIVSAAHEIGPLVRGLSTGDIAKRNAGSTAAVHNWQNRAKELIRIVEKSVR